MKEYFKIAWRNLWRNRRRTLITVTSIFLAIFLALFMRSMQLGSYNMMIENSVRTSTGYLQIHARGYWDDKSINNTFIPSDTLMEVIGNQEHITHAVPRLESFALCSFGLQTKGVMMIGIDPKAEDSLTGLRKKVERGRYLHPGEEALLIGKGLADYLKIEVGDSLVLLSQGYHGSTAAGLYPVVGVVDIMVPSISNAIAYTTLPAAQTFYGTHNRLTSLSIMLEDADQIGPTREVLSSVNPDKIEVMTWDEMLPELVQSIESDNISGLFMLGILYLVVGFGILGTIIMMTMERRKEFGIMVAVGMKRTKLILILVIETLAISLMGILSGIVLSFPVLAYFKANPIPLQGEAAKMMMELNVDPVLPFIIEPGFYINQSVTVMILAFLAALYPIRYIGNLRVVKAIKGK